MAVAVRLLSRQQSRRATRRYGCDFEQARAAFQIAWRIFSANRTEADYQAWRDHRDWTARKYALRDRGEPVPLR
jgi:hypothetical protein